MEGRAGRFFFFSFYFIPLRAVTYKMVPSIRKQVEAEVGRLSRRSVFYRGVGTSTSSGDQGSLSVGLIPEYRGKKDICCLVLPVTGLVPPQRNREPPGVFRESDRVRIGKVKVSFNVEHKHAVRVRMFAFLNGKQKTLIPLRSSDPYVVDEDKLVVSVRSLSAEDLFRQHVLTDGGPFPRDSHTVDALREGLLDSKVESVGRVQLYVNGKLSGRGHVVDEVLGSCTGSVVECCSSLTASVMVNRTFTYLEPEDSIVKGDRAEILLLLQGVYGSDLQDGYAGIVGNLSLEVWFSSA